MLSEKYLRITPDAPGAAGVYPDWVGVPAVFDFAFFFFALRLTAPFIPPNCRSLLNSPHSLLIT
jgi:hypothetical protein